MAAAQAGVKSDLAPAGLRLRVRVFASHAAMFPKHPGRHLTLRLDQNPLRSKLYVEQKGVVMSHYRSSSLPTR